MQTGTAPYAELARKLRQRILDDRRGPGEWIGTEVELAAANGVSRMTARRAVQKLVDEGLVERRPGRGVFVREGDSAARRIRFVAGNLMWQPAVRVAQAAAERAAAAGAELSMFDGRGDVSAVVAELAALRDRGDAGAIVMSQHDPAFNRALVGLVADGFPFVVVDQTLSDLPAPSVAADNRAGGRLAAETLLAAGHRRLAFFGDRADTSQLRALGAAEACAAAGAPPPADLTAEGARFGDWEPALAPVLRRALRRAGRPTGLVCSCDAVARIALRVLSGARLNVPGDVSVVGFDDDPIAEWTSPPLTTIRQDFSEMGRRAFAMLAEVLEGRASGAEVAPRAETVPVSLVGRGSVGECGNGVSGVENANRKIAI